MDTKKEREGSLARTCIIGCSSLAGLYTSIEEEVAVSTVAAALDAGFRMFDTAPHYGCGLGEERLGRALKAYGITKHLPRDIKLWTKIGRIMIKDGISSGELQRYASGQTLQLYQGRQVDMGNVPGSTGCIFPDAPLVLPVFDYSSEGCLQSFHDSEQRLLLHDLGIKVGLRVHDSETAEHIGAVLDRNSGALKAMVDLREQHLIEEVSIGVNDTSAALRILHESPRGALDTVMLAGQWNLLDHTADTLAFLCECEQRGVRVHNAGIFASGILAGGSTYRYQEAAESVRMKVKEWSDLCAEYDVPLPAVAVHFARLPTAVEAVAVGVKDVSEVGDIVRWFHWPLSQWAELYTEAKRRGLLSDHVPLPLL
jgi:D-threo-aldose 1-dehydrogenase